MRWVLAIAFVWALSVVPVFGCEVDVGESCFFPPCPNGGGCPICDGVVSEYDGNECTDHGCTCDTGECGIPEALNGMVCSLDGSAGVCEGGVCQEDVWCEGACDDGNECTVNFCRIGEGVCDEDITQVGDGTICSDGFCRNGVCGTLVDQCTTDDLSAIDADDEPKADAITACRGEWNGLPDPKAGCITYIKDCLQESGTSLSSECSSCFALRECCMVYECGCESPEPRCDDCLEESCQPLVDACVGGQ